ncbi:hypothetical protein FH972_022523 [Carpinus fangiana]|uniref:non-specific serine/threonine protein kinase n=1 Tax=Carpinus fangiana TaxID=176857 RepID=A0A5N6KT56_9ROSI|nr:hypothetical protein FH972_022523 [Carpinus fangiana]
MPEPWNVHNKSTTLSRLATLAHHYYYWATNHAAESCSIRAYLCALPHLTIAVPCGLEKLISRKNAPLALASPTRVALLLDYLSVATLLRRQYSGPRLLKSRYCRCKIQSNQPSASSFHVENSILMAPKGGHGSSSSSGDSSSSSSSSSSGYGSSSSSSSSDSGSNSCEGCHMPLFIDGSHFQSSNSLATIVIYSLCLVVALALLTLCGAWSGRAPKKTSKVGLSWMLPTAVAFWLLNLIVNIAIVATTQSTVVVTYAWYIIYIFSSLFYRIAEVLPAFIGFYLLGVRVSLDGRADKSFAGTKKASYGFAGLLALLTTVSWVVYTAYYGMVISSLDYNTELGYSTLKIDFAYSILWIVFSIVFFAVAITKLLRSSMSVKVVFAVLGFLFFLRSVIGAAQTGYAIWYDVYTPIADYLATVTGLDCTITLLNTAILAVLVVVQYRLVTGIPLAGSNANYASNGQYARVPPDRLVTHLPRLRPLLKAPHASPAAPLLPPRPALSNTHRTPSHSTRRSCHCRVLPVPAILYLTPPGMASEEAPKAAVRFSSATEDIQPAPFHPADSAAESPRQREDVPPEVQQELRDLSLNMQKSRLQHERMEKFAFEPVSLPTSRAPSPGASSRSASRAHSTRVSPTQSPAMTPVHGQTPPLTPAGSRSLEGKLNKGHGSSPNLAKPQDVITPQMSPPNRGRASGSAPGSRQPSPPAKRPAETAAAAASTGKSARFSIGPSGRSQPPSRDQSPSGRTGSSAGPQSGPGSPSIAPMAPKVKDDDPYGRAKRAAQNSIGIDPRSIFSKEARRTSNYMTTSKTSGSLTDAKSQSEVHSTKSSLFSGWYNSEHGHHDKHGSMHDLKRFFKFGGKHHKDKQSKSGDSASRKAASRRSGTSTPPTHASSKEAAMPFADDHGIESKYGKFGKVLGSGAGGSVRLMKRSSDGVTFAVKQFRPRHAHESEREYNKKVTAEFCIGSTLHDGNIIETMDIIQEKGNWYEVMEYAPYDLFAIVMTGKMSREEVTCCQMQIISGVSFLHSMGLAHRDLKLDNVVVNQHGIMKIIDFGSAVVFRYPFETENVRASGIVGSDPYLAPEVYDEGKYDAQAVDIWSLAIIYCCMTLRRFPWKMPRQTDTSYKLFVSTPSPGTPSIDSLRRPAEGGAKTTSGEVSKATSTTSSAKDAPAQPSSQIKGPWRLLRLLPRESRFIIGRMLDTNPATRATLEEIKADPWIASRPYCRQLEGGKVIAAEGHTHILEPSNTAPKAADKEAAGTKNDTPTLRRLAVTRQRIASAGPMPIPSYDSPGLDWGLVIVVECDDGVRTTSLDARKAPHAGLLLAGDSSLLPICVAVIAQWLRDSPRAAWLIVDTCSSRLSLPHVPAHHTTPRLRP